MDYYLDHLFILEPITTEFANGFIRRLIQEANPNLPEPSLAKVIWISSEGGSWHAARDIVHIMNQMRILNVKQSFTTAVLSRCWNAASLVLAAGDIGRRFVQPHSEIALHWGGLENSPSVSAENVVTQKEVLVEIFEQYTKVSADVITSLFINDTFTPATAALEIGLADVIGMPHFPL